jgi:hypothetical protein
MGENTGELRVEDRKELKSVEIPGERADVAARRAEVRSLLVRLLVKLYVERHEDLVKDAA